MKYIFTILALILIVAAVCMGKTDSQINKQTLTFDTIRVSFNYDIQDTLTTICDTLVTKVERSNSILSAIKKIISECKRRKIFGIPLDLIITFAFGIIATMFGVFLNYYLTTRKKRINFQRMYIFFLTTVLDAAMKQSENVKALVELLTEEKTYSIYKMKAISSFNFNSLRKVPLELIIDKILKSRKQAEEFKYISTNLDVLETISIRYIVDFETMVTKFNNYLDEWNYNINKIREIFDTGAQLYKTTYKRGKDPFFDKFDEIFANYQDQEDQRDYYITNIYLLKPLQNLCKEKIENPNSVYLNRHVLACMGAFDDWKRAKEVYIDIFSSYIESIEEKVKSIDKNIFVLFKVKLSLNKNKKDSAAVK